MIEETSTVTDLTAELRGKLVDELCEWEPFRAAMVENAMRTVPRRVFLPGIPAGDSAKRGRAAASSRVARQLQRQRPRSIRVR